MVDITPTDSHESSTFEASLPKGSDSFTVALKGNQTTGYAWELVLPLPTGIEATGDQYSTDQHDAPMVGVPGLHRFSFKKGADSPLSFTLNFQYKRSWEPDPIKTLQVRVTA
ncbi:hypothetical protein HDU99_009871 [Rhizoclosmatium hyalinum]|nr:hypothetical protein HDU99_009871 [Rhizoclosmatium hyalinum]